MITNKIKKLFNGASGDSFFLMVVRMVTIVFGLLMTRVLSQHFSLEDYGTYSQIMLLVTTISSLTILGMSDGINFFFCKENDVNKRNNYVSTIFFLQFCISIIASVVVLVCAVPISIYFDNDKLKSLIIFAAILPVSQNAISLLQIMFIAIGKARLIAIRNLIISILKLAAIILACYVFDNIVILLLCQALMDLLQISYFIISLKKDKCNVRFFKFDKSLIKEILKYCVPMAMYTIIKSINRDCDKFVISYFTNTQTLAIYTNASKILPFDIVMTSFCTVILPFITRYIKEKDFLITQSVYKAFFELSYITTIIFAIAIIIAAPEAMTFLYSEKYILNDFGVNVFIIYTVVEVFNILNITLILSASGKTKSIMIASIGTFLGNIILNVVFFLLFKEIGPAISTLLVTIIQGLIIFRLSVKEINSKITDIINFKYFIIFLLEIILFSGIIGLFKIVFLQDKVHYIVTLILTSTLFCGPLLLINYKRILQNIMIINQCRYVDIVENISK